MAQKKMLRRLNVTFGKIPSLILENVKNISYNDESEDFACVPCNKIIKISHETYNTTNNFKKHLNTTVHKNNTISTNVLIKHLSSTFGNEIPPIVLMNIHTLGKSGENYNCVICNKTVLVSYNGSFTEKNFSYHLLSIGHKKKLLTYNNALNKLFAIYGGISCTIMNHISFLSKSGKHYLCTICDKQLMVHPSDVKETEKAFEKHLHSQTHIKNAKQSKAFSLTPELKMIFSTIPNYIFRNLEYISTNGSNFFCSLCHENIKFNKNDVYESELNFKVHILSSSHKENLDCRKDPNNEVISRICSIFEGLPNIVQENLKYLTLNVDYFYCEICKETIYKYDKPEETNESLALHFGSTHHKKMVSLKEDKSLEALLDLNDVFGFIPYSIQDNLQHIEFKSGKQFECNLCNKVLQAKFDSDYEDNTRVTENNFQKHLQSNGHEHELEKTEQISNDILGDLEDMFSPIPQYIINNINYLAYDDNDNFKCILCDKVIAVDHGNKKNEVTEQNFQKHFLSSGHFEKLKHKANLVMGTTEKLEFIFSKTPNFVKGNIEHIELQDNHYRCTLCDAQLPRGGGMSTEKQFRLHLFGSRHRSQLELIDRDNFEALQQLDNLFWRVPEFILRNVDFLQIVKGNLYCIVCQEQLVIDEEDLVKAIQSLRNHMYSKRHQSIFRNV